MNAIKFVGPAKCNVGEFQSIADSLASGCVVQVVDDPSGAIVVLEGPDETDLDAIRDAILNAPILKTDAEVFIERAAVEAQEKSFNLPTWRAEVERRLSALEGGK